MPQMHVHTRLPSAQGLYLMSFNILGFALLKYRFHFPLPENNCMTFITQGKTAPFTILIWHILHVRWTKRFFLAWLLARSWQWELTTFCVSLDDSGDRGRRLVYTVFAIWHSRYYCQMILKTHMSSLGFLFSSSVEEKPKGSMNV